MGITYRILDRSEWERLSSIMNEKYIPHPDSATVAVAEEDGKLMGCLFLQLAFHVEPLVLSSPKVSFQRLHDTIIESISGHKGLRIYAFSDKEIVDRMAEHAGMKRTPYRVFEQEIT